VCLQTRTIVNVHLRRRRKFMLYTHLKDYYEHHINKEVFDPLSPSELP